jgi:recombination protein RecA
MFQRTYPRKRIAWVDMEQTFDQEWAETLGLDMDRVWFYTPATAEDVSDATKKFVHSGLCSLVVLDSVGGMISRIEMEKNADEDTVGLVPKIVTRMVKACAPAATQNGTTLHVINQVRSQIGGFGADETTGGGWALKHITTVKMAVRAAGGEGTIHYAKVPGVQKEIPVGFKIAFRIQKNKMGPKGKVAEVWFHNVETKEFGPIGFDLPFEVFQISKRMRLLGSKGGGYYRMPDGTEVRGEPAAIQHLRDHEGDVQALRVKILDQVKDQVHEEGDDGESDDPMGIAEVLA